MRVLFVHHRSEVGGAPKSLALLIKAMRSEVDAHVACPAGPAMELFRGAGAEVTEIPMASFCHLWTGSYSWGRLALLGRDTLRARSHMRAVTCAIQAVRPHLVHLNDSPLIFAARAANRANVPVVWHLRTALAEGALGRAVVTGSLRRWADGAIAINEDVAASFGQADIDVVPNIVDIPDTTGARVPTPSDKLKAGLPTSGVLVGMLSNMYGLKGYADLIGAVARLRALGLPLSAVLVGDPVRPSTWYQRPGRRTAARLVGVADEERRLQMMIERLDLADAVVWVRHADDLGSIYPALDLICAPSRGPELGRPLLEGQAYGRPVIATGSRTGAGIIDHGRTGVLAPPDDEEALAAALRPLVEDEQLRGRIGAAAYRHAAASYTADIVGARVLTVYDRVSHAVVSPRRSSR